MNDTIIKKEDIMAHLSLKSIYTTYSNGFEAVKNFNIEIQDKESSLLDQAAVGNQQYCV